MAGTGRGAGHDTAAGAAGTLPVMRADKPEPEQAKSQPAENDAPLGADMEPWWAGLGPVAAVLLIVVGVALLVWLHLTSSDTPGDGAVTGYQISRLVVIGMVVAGGGILARHRARNAKRAAPHGADED
ncbi:hypothetical protein SCATT_p12050 (plasmid) [Streptantibioticus cattleyicolor NRRL 8057 = DSM 46488]|uniref:Uncharacterized protein n=2 Tax=Streptantibioticus cattleyicolor TaxID=29303 RepID=G8XF56_STREN|nr:hypothetical protein SCATT_p12050 [Streptantibioticus cattleyicolor NRRL 8057 = DSM 46488]